MPVLPAVASMTVPPGFSLPVRSASSIKPIAARSFTLPPGFRYSSLAKISAAPGGASLFICSIGVSPTSLEISSLTRRREFEVTSGTLQSKEQEGEASMQGLGNLQFVIFQSLVNLKCPAGDPPGKQSGSNYKSQITNCKFFSTA